MEYSNVKFTGVSVSSKEELADGYLNRIVLEWAGDIGFGQYKIFQTSDGKWYADSESMDSEEDHSFLEHLLNQLSKIIGVY